MEELKERLLSAVSTLELLLADTKASTYKDQWNWDEQNRLRAKISGVRLALSYVEEELRA